MLESVEDKLVLSWLRDKFSFVCPDLWVLLHIDRGVCAACYYLFASLFRTQMWSCGTSSMRVGCTGWEAIKTSSHRPCSSKTRTSWWRGNTPFNGYLTNLATRCRLSQLMIRNISSRITRAHLYFDVYFGVIKFPRVLSLHKYKHGVTLYAQ